jgi:hypothetical protein
LNISETLLAYSVEGLLTDAEANAVLDMIDHQTAGLPADRMIPGRNGRSIHTIEGFSVEQTVAVYEPRGRRELETVPGPVSEVMERAVQRRWVDIRRAMPSARRLAPWIYVEYGPDQYITPHIDDAWNEDLPAPPRWRGSASS